MKALIVDDEPHVITVAKLLVDWNKYKIDQVFECVDSGEALEIIKRERPAVILSDIRMPDMDGLTLISEVKRIDPSLQTIFISAYSDFSYAQKAISLGCVDYLLKPLTEEGLNQAVAKAVSQYLSEQTLNTLSLRIPKDTYLSKPGSSAETDPEDTLNQIHRYIREHFTEPLSLDSLAEHFALSPSYLSRSFKKRYNICLVDFITQVRIDQAKHLISNSPLRLHEVASHVGISDPKYFSRVFKRVTGVSPAEYRMKGETLQ